MIEIIWAEDTGQVLDSHLRKIKRRLEKLKLKMIVLTITPQERQTMIVFHSL